MTKVYIGPPQFMLEHLIAEGDFLTVIGKTSLKDEHGTMTGYDYCDVWQFRDGKLDKLKAFRSVRVDGRGRCDILML